MSEATAESDSLLALDPVIRLDVAWFQDNVDERVLAVSVPPDQIIRGRMATVARVELALSDGRTSTAVVKRVVPTELEAKDKMESFLASARREICVYATLGFLDQKYFPRVFGAFERKEQGNPGFLIIMEDLLPSGYYQCRSVSDLARARSAIAALTRFSLAPKRLQEGYQFMLKDQSSTEALAQRGTFWPMGRRPLDEIRDGPAGWEAFCTRFDGVLPEAGLSQEGMVQVGKQLASDASRLDALASSHAVTWVHGDAKCWNLFLPQDTAAEVKLIDMQWAGMGHPLQDLVYFLTTSVDCAALGAINDEVWNQLVDEHRMAVEAGFNAILPALEAAGGTPKSLEAFKQALLCSSPVAYRALACSLWLDYVRVVFFGLWRRLDVEKVVANSTKVGISLVTGSTAQMAWILKNASKLLIQPAKC